MKANKASFYKGYRFAPEIISYVVWLYFRFPLIFWMVEEMVAVRGMSVSQILRDYPETPYIFVSERKAPMTDSTFRKLLARAGCAAKLGISVHPHMLHTQPVLNWQMMGRTPGLSNIILGTEIFKILCPTHSLLPAALMTSGMIELS